MNPTTRFSDRVSYYVKSRPGYPAAVLDYLAAEMNFTPQAVVADLGAGTGISARLFLERGNLVYGVEPNAEMRAAAEEYLRAYPRFQSIAATAEATTLPDRSVDFVVAAQAFHWFAVAQARAEARRILKPDGWAVLLWNDRKTAATPFLQAYEALLLRYASDYTQISHRNAQAVDYRAITEFFGHSEWKQASFANFQAFDYEGLRERTLSSSYAPLAGQPNHEPMIEGLRELFALHNEAGQVRFEYETRVFAGRLG
jgi:SAM-dependent methyltransferase